MPRSKEPIPAAATSQQQLLLPSGEHRLRSENLAFDIDVWYPSVAAHTFRTEFLPLTRREAAAMVAYYNATHRSLPDELTGSVVETLEALEVRLDAFLRRHFVVDTPDERADAGAFLRLCGRSPKDGEPTDPAVRAGIWQKYRVALQELARETGRDPKEGNLRVAAICRTESWLRVRSGADCMSLLLTSERVFSDMLDWLNYGEPEQIVLREWSSAFDLSTEFRCYIQHGVLQGISQYDVYAKHAFLQESEHRDCVIQALVKEWLKVRECIETIDGSYCADFGVDLVAGRAHLIELSPFRRCTGPALFAWKDEARLVCPDRSDVLDVPILSHVEDIQADYVSQDAVLRVRSVAIPRIGDLVEVNWDFRWSGDNVHTPKPYREVYANAGPITKASLCDRMNGWLFREGEEQNLLFVYGTLKQGCHWNAKYMTGAELLGEAVTTDPQSLVIGQCGVPYMFRLAATNAASASTDDQAKIVRGELWRVSDEMLRGIDDYEGICKGHYSREEIAVGLSSSATAALKPNYRAFCYFYAIKPGESDVDVSLLQAPRISEYTVEEQKKRYKAIHHIQVKQLQYLGEEATT